MIKAVDGLYREYHGTDLSATGNNTVRLGQAGARVEVRVYTSHIAY